MKRLTVTSLALLLTFLFTDIADAQVKTGAKGGLTFANLHGASENFDNRVGFLIGGFAKFSLPGTPFAIQPEIMYSQKGAADGGNEIRVDYLEIPVLIKYAVVPTGVVQPNLFIGPYAGIRLIAESDGGLLGGSTNLENETHPIDYGGAAGAGLDIEVGSSIFTVDARYSYGFRDLFRNDAGKNGVFAISIGISLPNL